MIFAIVGQLVCGWLLADLVTGAFHWWEDRHQHLAHWPILGPLIIQPNILHHEAPHAFTQGSFWYRNGASIITAALVGILWLWLIGPSVLMAAMLVGSALSNEIHCLAHSPRSGPPLIRAFQQTGLLQSPKAHALHHRPPHGINFCVMTDWLNPLLELAGFWGAIEFVFCKRRAA